MHVLLWLPVLLRVVLCVVLCVVLRFGFIPDHHGAVQVQPYCDCYSSHSMIEVSLCRGLCGSDSFVEVAVSVGTTFHKKLAWGW